MPPFGSLLYRSYRGGIKSFLVGCQTRARKNTNERAVVGSWVTEVVYRRRGTKETALAKFHGPLRNDTLDDSFQQRRPREL